MKLDRVDRSLLTPSLYPVALDALPERILREGRYEVGFARSQAELDEILRLRFEIFNLELGEGLDSSHETGKDEDRFDAVCHHLFVRDVPSGRIVGSYRLQSNSMARAHKGFYSAEEYDLSTLPEPVLDQAVELGRACVARSHRTSQVLFLLWKGLSLYLSTNEKRYLFGCSSFTSQDPALGAAWLRFFEEEGFVHPELWVDTRPEFECREPDPAPGADPMVANRRDLPILFRTYLRYGAKIIGAPARDQRFKTIDFLVMIDVDGMPRRILERFAC